MSIKHRSNDNQVPIYSNLMPILSQSSSNPAPLRRQSSVNQFQFDANLVPVQCQCVAIRCQSYVNTAAAYPNLMPICANPMSIKQQSRPNPFQSDVNPLHSGVNPIPIQCQSNPVSIKRQSDVDQGPIQRQSVANWMSTKHQSVPI